MKSFALETCRSDGNFRSHGDRLGRARALGAFPEPSHRAQFWAGRHCGGCTPAVRRPPGRRGGDECRPEAGPRSINTPVASEAVKNPRLLASLLSDVRSPSSSWGSCARPAAAGRPRPERLWRDGDRTEGAERVDDPARPIDVDRVGADTQGSMAPSRALTTRTSRREKRSPHQTRKGRGERTRELPGGRSDADRPDPRHGRRRKPTARSRRPSPRTWRHPTREPGAPGPGWQRRPSGRAAKTGTSAGHHPWWRQPTAEGHRESGEARNRTGGTAVFSDRPEERLRLFPDGLLPMSCHGFKPPPLCMESSTLARYCVGDVAGEHRTEEWRTWDDSRDAEPYERQPREVSTGEGSRWSLANPIRGSIRHTPGASTPEVHSKLD